MMKGFYFTDDEGIVFDIRGSNYYRCDVSYCDVQWPISTGREIVFGEVN